MSVVETVRKVMVRYEIPEHIWRPIMLMESGGRPDAVNRTAREYSVGLFQINLLAHPEYADLNLKNPQVNAEIAARDFLSRAWRRANERYPANPRAQAEHVWRYGIRPDWGALSEKRKQQFYGYVDKATLGMLDDTPPKKKWWRQEPEDFYHFPDEQIESSGGWFQNIKTGFLTNIIRLVFIFIILILVIVAFSKVTEFKPATVMQQLPIAKTVKKVEKVIKND